MGDAIGSRRRPRGARGQSMIEYALIIAVISLVVVFVGPSLSQAITQQFEKIVETLGGSISWPGANPGQPGGGQRPDPNPTPDPEKPGGGGEGVDPDKPITAFAVFSADDGSLNFYKRSEVPAAGSQFEGKTATEVYTGIEDGTCYDDGVYVKWESRLNSREIRFVCVKDAISPGRMQNWFRNSALEEVDFTLLDTSSTRGKDWLFDGCSDLRILRIGENFDWRGRSCRPPAPSASQIPGADGKWYNSKGTGFAPADIPSNVADTYYASRDLVPSNGFSLLKMIEDGVHALMGFFAPRN